MIALSGFRRAWPQQLHRFNRRRAKTASRSARKYHSPHNNSNIVAVVKANSRKLSFIIFLSNAPILSSTSNASSCSANRLSSRKLKNFCINCTKGN